jgi:hypothetical protein
VSAAVAALFPNPRRENLPFGNVILLRPKLFRSAECDPKLIQRLYPHPFFGSSVGYRDTQGIEHAVEVADARAKLNNCSPKESGQFHSQAQQRR